MVVVTGSALESEEEMATVLEMAVPGMAAEEMATAAEVPRDLELSL
jgi:hypothetical protein